MAEQQVLAELGDGLIVRRATVADAEELAAFNADVHRYGAPEPNAAMAAWTRDAIRGTVPGAANCTVVRAGGGGPIISSLCLIPQRWCYEGIDLGVSRIESVGTHPDYRCRGLIRRQMALVQGWSAERGDLMQVVGGRPYFYRQFGHEPALDQPGGWAGNVGIVQQAQGRMEGYTIRPATAADLDFITALDDGAAARYAVCCRRDLAAWRHELTGYVTDNHSRRELRLIESPSGDPVGYVAHDGRLWGDTLSLRAFELLPGQAWRPVAAAVLGYLGTRAEEYARVAGEPPPPRVAFRLGDHHPALAATMRVLSQPVASSPWYVRVPDLAALLRRIGPALERRLEGSMISGYSGELRLTFYRSGLRLAFVGGRLVAVEATPAGDDADAAFPDLTFLKLVFGYRDLDEVRHAFPDCWASAAAERLLRALFPRRPSLIWPVG
ncbi:MAG: GNAT family N-acetyltransferase [Anaerolineae bacterium]